MFDIDDVRRAHERIRDDVRRTPCLPARLLREPPWPGARLALKLECLQVCGSFKARGASNKLRALDPHDVARGLVTASGGNHGLGVAYAGWRAGAPVRVYVPESTPRAKVAKIAAWGAEVVVEGAVWDDANAAALADTEREGRTYVHAFADPLVAAGQGTVGLEILEQAPDLDTVVVAIGGGGLVSGVATAIKAARPRARVVGVEPVGAPTLYESVRAGRLVELARIDTAAGTLAPRRSEPMNLDVVRRLVDEIVLVDDDEMRDAARWLWFECGVAAELSAAAAVAALRTGRYAARRDEAVCAIVCGAGSDGIE